MKGSKVSIVDVARNAGVSPATVSRVLSNNECVKKESVEAVLKSIKELNYRPNVVARQLRTQKTNAIYVIVPDITNTFFGPIIRGIEQEAQKSGYYIYIVDAHQSEKAEKGFISALGQRQIDGIISLSGTTAIQTVEKLSDGFPIVMASQYYEGSRLPNIGIDNAKAMEDICNYIISLGHREIGFISPNPYISLYQDRHNGYVKALTEHDLEVDVNKEVYTAYNSIQEGYDAAKKLIASARVTAICAAGDSLALGAIKAIQDMGLSVPGDYSVTGFDDISFASYATPTLTTVHQPMHEMGSGAMRILKSILNGEKTDNSRIVLEHSVIIRESTAEYVRP